MQSGEKHMKSSQISYTDKKGIRAIIILAALLAAAAVASICIGSTGVPMKKLFSIVFLGERGTMEANIILLARLPRLFGAVTAGAALAVSGAVIQSVLANPLAAPNVIGVNAGAGLAVALFSALAPASLAGFMPIAAFAGALAAVLTVLFIAERSGASKITLVLAGVAVSSVFSALVDAVITIVPDSLSGYSDFRIGGLSNVSNERVLPAFAVFTVALVILLSMHNEIDVLALGADTAQSLGLNVRPVRIILLALAAALAGAAVSFAGLVGFVGLIVPHIMRSIAGENSTELIISSSLGGALLLTVCDLVSRTLFSPYELPVGIILACIGGPFFIRLLISQRGGRNRD